MEGLRDFSVIATAPQKRLAIKTFVSRFSDGIIREAVLRELKRGGLPAQESAALKSLFTGFVIGLHDRGVYFRSLHLGNVILTPEGELGLIDFADLRIHPWPLGRYLRSRNMRRMMDIEEDRDWVDLDAIVQARRTVVVET